MIKNINNFAKLHDISRSRAFSAKPMLTLARSGLNNTAQRLVHLKVT